jgi:hypothetical protein
MILSEDLTMFFDILNNLLVAIRPKSEIEILQEKEQENERSNS